jgi:anti-anti-sigma regulatory factor
MAASKPDGRGGRSPQIHLHVSSEHDEGHIVLRGELDENTVVAVTCGLRGLRGLAIGRVRLELSQVTFINEPAIAALAAAKHEWEASGRQFYMVNAPEALQLLLRQHHLLLPHV